MYIYLHTSDKRVTLLREVSAMVDLHKSSDSSSTSEGLKPDSDAVAVSVCV